MNLTQFITILAGAFFVVGIMLVLLFMSGFWNKTTVNELEQNYPEFFVEETVAPFSIPSRP
jgi:preprotein translocase subunit SecG